MKLKKIHKKNSNDLTYSLLKLENRKTSYGGITINQNGVVKKHKNLTHNSKFSIIDSGFRIINKNAIIDYHQTNTNLVQSFEYDIAPWLIKNKKVKGVLFNSNFLILVIQNLTLYQNQIFNRLKVSYKFKLH